MSMLTSVPPSGLCETCGEISNFFHPTRKKWFCYEHKPDGESFVNRADNPVIVEREGCSFGGDHCLYCCQCNDCKMDRLAFVSGAV